MTDQRDPPAEEPATPGERARAAEELERTSGYPGAEHFGSNKEELAQAQVGVGSDGAAPAGGASSQSDEVVHEQVFLEE